VVKEGGRAVKGPSILKGDSHDNTGKCGWKAVWRVLLAHGEPANNF